MVKNLPAMQVTQVSSMGQEDLTWRREGQPTPVFLPGESHGMRSLAGYSPWSHKEWDTTEQLTLTFQLQLVFVSQQGLPLGGLYRNDASKHSVAGDTMRPMLKVHLPYPGAMAWNAPRVTERACSSPVLQMPPPLTAYIMPIISEPASGSLERLSLGLEAPPPRELDFLKEVVSLSTIICGLWSLAKKVGL